MRMLSLNVNVVGLVSAFPANFWCRDLTETFDWNFRCQLFTDTFDSNSLQLLITTRAVEPLTALLNSCRRFDSKVAI